MKTKKIWLTVLFIAILWSGAYVFNHIEAWAGFGIVVVDIFWYVWFLSHTKK